MLQSSDGETLISHLGWVDHGSVLQVRPANNNEARSVQLSDAEYLRPYEGAQDLFSVAHYYAGRLRAISVHRFSKPRDAVARVNLERQTATFEGDGRAWTVVPRMYVGYLDEGAVGATGHYLVRLHGASEQASLDRLIWFGPGSYDLGYQTLLGPVEVPNTTLVIIPIQRDSRPALYDVVSHRVVGHLRLAERYGNPVVYLRLSAGEAWASDYDTLVRLKTNDWSILDEMRVQSPRDGARCFIGEFSFNKGESLCAVARPFSGDVLAITTNSFRVSHRAVLGRQPLDVALLSDMRVVARDWKTGDLLAGRLDPHVMTS